MDLGLKGKAVLVFGSSRGLGQATATVFAQEGARVAINGRDAARLQASASAMASATGAEVIPIPGDVARPEGPQEIVGQAAGRFGGLDIVVLNSGGPPPGRFDELNDDAWMQAANLLLMSTVRAVRAALPYLRRSSSPAVLAITSYAIKQPLPNLILSNSLRAAVAGLVKSLALELGSEGLRFNCILPAWTATERVAMLMADRARRAGTTAEEEARKQAASSPLGRLGLPEELARAAAFLCSPAASYITGEMLTVDGGMYKGLF